jgi:hypothetical protein
VRVRGRKDREALPTSRPHINILATKHVKVRKLGDRHGDRVGIDMEIGMMTQPDSTCVITLNTTTQASQYTLGYDLHRLTMSQPMINKLQRCTGYVRDQSTSFVEHR